jgi:hypothetical protein
MISDYTNNEPFATLSLVHYNKITRWLKGALAMTNILELATDKDIDADTLDAYMQVLRYQIELTLEVFEEISVNE